LVNTNITDYIGGASTDTVILLATSRDKRTANSNANTLYNDYVSLSVGSAPVTGSTDPKVLAQYEFTEIRSEPSMVGHWRLDDVTDELATTYDCASLTPGTDIVAYEGLGVNAVPADNITPASELSGGAYSDIEADDADEHSYVTTSNGRFAQMRYMAQIDESESEVFRLEGEWIGRNVNEHGSPTDGVELHIWNYSAGSYEQLDVSADTEAEVTLSASITSNLPDYIGGGSDDTVTLLAVSRGASAGGKDNTLYNDYMSIKINGGLYAAENQTGNDGSALGGVTSGAAGNGDGGTAFPFDGIDDYVEIPHAGAYLLDHGAVSFWFTSDDLTGHRGLVSKDSAGFDTGGHLHVYTDGSTLKARLQSTAATYEVTSSGLSAGAWYHVVVSFGPAGLKLFVNGSEVDSNSYTGGMGLNSGGAGNYEPIVLGANTQNSGDLASTPLQDYFQGSIDDLRIFDRGLNATQATNIYNGNNPGEGDATTVYDTGGYGQPLNLMIEDVANTAWQAGGGLTINSATRIISSGAATKLYDAMTATNELSLEVVFTPANVAQGGPARIVSYSGGTADRNVTFGQEADSYITRLSTTTTTSNGTPDADSGSMLAPAVQQHVVITYDGANVTMYDGVGSSVSLARTGDFSWDSSFRLMFGNEAVDGYGWLGTLDRVVIYDRAFNQTQASSVFGGLPPGNGSGIGGVDWVEP
jgi:hypothetical protein